MKTKGRRQSTNIEDMRNVTTRNKSESRNTRDYGKEMTARAMAYPENSYKKAPHWLDRGKPRIEMTPEVHERKQRGRAVFLGSTDFGAPPTRFYKKDK